MSDKQRQWTRDSEARAIERGGRRIPGGILSPEAARALDQLRDTAYATSLRGVIDRALCEAAELQAASAVTEHT